MSAALVNRSLTTVRTELEFLKDSDIITEALYNKLVDALPAKYQKDSEPWDVDRLTTSSDPMSKAKATASEIPTPSYSTTNLSEDLSKTKLDNPAPPAYAPPPRSEPGPVGYCIAVYDYKAQEEDDITLAKGDKVAVIEHLSEDWWKGYKSGSAPDKAGVFPSNYVKVISEQEFNMSRLAALTPQSQDKPSYSPQQQYANYGQQGYGQQQGYNQQYNQGVQQQQPYGQNQQITNGGYGSNYYPPQQYQAPPQQVAQQQPQQEGGHHDRLRKYGSQFASATVFGAGASVGANLINGIL